MAATYLRLKRKRHEEPSEKLIVACKKGKRDTSDVKKEIFKLAGTTNSKDGCGMKNVIDLFNNQSSATSSPAANQLPSHKLSTPSSSSTSKKRCYSLIGQESLQLDGEDDTPGSNILIYDAILSDAKVSEGQTSVDVSSSTQLTSEPMSVTSEGEDEFVYDIFCLDSNSGIYDTELLDNVLCIEAYGEDYSQLLDYRFDRVYEDDDDDSNDEDNWRNDYPDEDYNRSSGEEDPDQGEGVAGVLRFDRIRLASSESEVSSEEEDLEGLKFTGSDEFERYYRSYKKSRRRGRGIGECNTSDEDAESHSDCNDDL